MTSVSRRKLLTGGLAGGAFLLFDHHFGFEPLHAQDAGDDLDTILNLAITAETFICTHYYTVLTEGNVPLVPAERAFISAALDTELQHYQYLAARGARPVSTRFYTPRNIYNNRANFSTLTEQFESGFVAAYLAATRRIAELGDPLLAATTAQIAVTEGIHLALIRQIGERLPNNLSMAQGLYYDTSEIVPVLQPVIDGGSGMTGPRDFPGQDTIRALIGDNSVTAVEPFSAPEQADES